MVAKPPLVMNDAVRTLCSCWPAPFLFQPTSVTKIDILRRCLGQLLEQASGVDGLAAVFLGFHELVRQSCLRLATISACALIACAGRERLARRSINAWRVTFASPTMPSSTG